jgi:hypothetical protein
MLGEPRVKSKFVRLRSHNDARNVQLESGARLQLAQPRETRMLLAKPDFDGVATDDKVDKTLSEGRVLFLTRGTRSSKFIMISLNSRASAARARTS